MNNVFATTAAIITFSKNQNFPSNDVFYFFASLNSIQNIQLWCEFLMELCLEKLRSGKVSFCQFIHKAPEFLPESFWVLNDSALYRLWL